MTRQTIFNVLNLGAGVQSSRVLLGMCLGELPRVDAAIFADTQWEPRGVYDNLAFLRSHGERYGIPVIVRTASNIRSDAIEMRRKRVDGKRYASIPLFVSKQDGGQGRIRRQCTKEYKIDVVERWIRRELLGLNPGARIPSGVVVRQWFGISDDEGSRARFPGRFQTGTRMDGYTLFDEPLTSKLKTWKPRPWSRHVYPLLNQIWLPERKIQEVRLLPQREQRADCAKWLTDHFPDRTFPRSACIGCPFRSNAEWRDMRDQRPEEWEDACRFDDEIRSTEVLSSTWDKRLRGRPYVHRQMVPLRLADLYADGEKGGGCGTLLDGMDGLCDV